MEEENNKDPTIIFNNTENETSREKIKTFASLIIKIKEEKNKNFQKAVKKFKNDENYEFNHPLIEKHSLFKALQEGNELLSKTNEGFLFDFTNESHYYFEIDLMFYFKDKGYYTDDGLLKRELANEHLYYLDQVIKQNTNDKEFIQCSENLKTDLPLIYINYIDFDCFNDQKKKIFMTL